MPLRHGACPRLSLQPGGPAACRGDEKARGSYDLGSYQDIKNQEAAGIVFYDTASVLFGVEGLRVTDVESGPGGAAEVGGHRSSGRDVLPGLRDRVVAGA